MQDKLRHFRLGLALAVVYSFANAQSVTYPGMPTLKTYVNKSHGVSIQFPESWLLNAVSKNELWIASGNIRGYQGICFVRLSSVENLGRVGLDAYFAQTTESSLRNNLSLGMPDIKIHAFEFGFLGGRKARRTIYSGSDNGIKTTTLTYQTLDGDKIFTFACLSESGYFLHLASDFEAIASTFKFSR